MQITPEMQEQFGKAWAAMAAGEGHRAGFPVRDRMTAREEIAELVSDGEWHSSDELAAAGGIAKNNLRKYVHKMGLERRSVPQPRGGRIVEWRQA